MQYCQLFYCFYKQAHTLLAPQVSCKGAWPQGIQARGGLKYAHKMLLLVLTACIKLRLPSLRTVLDDYYNGEHTVMCHVLEWTLIWS